MENILKLIESYGISLNKVPSQELLETVDYQTCKDTMKYLHDSSLLKSKFIVNKLAFILSSTNAESLRWLEETLTSNGLNAYEIMYKANGLLTFDNRNRTLEVIEELKKEEHNLDYKKVLSSYSTLIIRTSPEQIKKAVETLRNNGLDPRKVTSSSADVLDKGSLNFTEPVIRIVYNYFGEEEGKSLIYKCTSLLSKGNPDEIKSILEFFESKIGKEQTKEFFTKNTSLLARGHKEQIITTYQGLEELGIEHLIFVSAAILMRGNILDIKNNYTWLKEQNPDIDIESTPVTLTYPHQTIKNNYMFYKNHNLDQYITNRASCLGRTRSTQELEDIYSFLVSLGIKEFEEYLSVISTTNLHEMEQIYKLLIEEFGKDKADELIKTPSILLSNYISLKDSISFIRDHELFDELQDKPYVLSETYKDKMEANLEYLQTLDIPGLTSNISIISRGDITNMRNIISYLESLGLKEILISSPIILAKRYKNIRASIEFFIKIDRLDIVRNTPSVVVLKAEEIENAHQDIKDLGLDELLEENPNILRGKSIKKNATNIKRDKFTSSSGIASIYSSASTKVNARKKFYDDNNLEFLYQKAPSILSEGNVETIEESYQTLIEEDLTSILSRCPSIITRLKGREAIKERLEHLYSLGLTKDDIRNLPNTLVRYSDEEVLRQLQAPRRNRK